MTATTKFFTALAGIFLVAGLAIYLFGIPPEVKRKMERAALNTMGENKMSYVAKGQIEKIPASDQEDVKQLKKGLGNAVGGGLKNPLGEAAVRAVNQAWDTVQDVSKTAYERVNETTKQAKEESQKE